MWSITLILPSEVFDAADLVSFYTNDAVDLSSRQHDPAATRDSNCSNRTILIDSGVGID